MKSLRVFAFLLLLAFSFGSFQLTAAPKTIEEINEEQEKKEVEKRIAKEDEKKTKEEECNNGSAKDCFSYAQHFAQNDKEKFVYFNKACDLQYQPGCDEAQKIKAAVKTEKARIAKEKKHKAEEEAKRIKDEKNQRITNELNQAGRKKRLIIASSTLAGGAILTILGGVSFVGMNKAEKNRKKYYQEYLTSKYPDDADYFWRKANNSDKKRKTYMRLGFAGIGVGVALIATGITFYSIEFKGEKEVKKKYNLSFGANPAERTMQFALKW